MKRIDFADILILIGFAALIFGIAGKYSVEDAQITAGVLLLLMGLFFAGAASVRPKQKR